MFTASSATTVATVGTGALILAGAKVAGTLIISGFLLAVGFWGAKKLTNWIDLKVAMRKSNINRLTKEHVGEIT